jgi:hypothetical protein
VKKRKEQRERETERERTIEKNGRKEEKRK